MADYKKITDSKISFSIEITQEDIEKSKKAVLRNIAKEISLPGYRKGHAPENIILENIDQKILRDDAMNHVIEKKVFQFSKKNDLGFLSLTHEKKDKIDSKQKNFKINFVAEICPKFELSTDYKKIKLTKHKVEISKKETEAVIQDFLSKNNFTKKIKQIKRIENIKVLLKIKLSKEKKENKPEFKLMVGICEFLSERAFFLERLENILPGIQKLLKNASEGEVKKNLKIVLPKKYFIEELSGKTFYFDIKVEEIQDFDLSILDDPEFFKTLNFGDTKEKFIHNINKNIALQKIRNIEDSLFDEFVLKLSKLVKPDIPEFFIKKTKNEIISEALLNKKYDNGKSKEENIKLIKEDYKKDLDTESIKNLFKSFIAKDQLIALENIKLTKEEKKYAIKIAKKEYVKSKKKKQKSDYKKELENCIIHIKFDKYVVDFIAPYIPKAEEFVDLK